MATRELDGQVVECRASNGVRSGVTGTFILNMRCKRTVQMHTVMWLHCKSVYYYFVYNDIANKFFSWCAFWSFMVSEMVYIDKSQSEIVIVLEHFTIEFLTLL